MDIEQRERAQDKQLERLEMKPDEQLIKIAFASNKTTVNPHPLWERLRRLEFIGENFVFAGVLTEL